MNLRLSNKQVYRLAFMKATTARVLIYLAYLSYDTEVIHIDALCRIAHVTKEVAQNAIKELLQAEILTEHENGIDYILNGRAFCVG